MRRKRIYTPPVDGLMRFASTVAAIVVIGVAGALKVTPLRGRPQPSHDRTRTPHRPADIGRPAAVFACRSTPFCIGVRREVSHAEARGQIVVDRVNLGGADRFG